MSRLFGEPRQLGYVVPDIEAAMKHWTEALGIGPFFYFPRVVVIDGVYRGNPQRFEIAVALSQSGPMQIELMCQLDAGPSALRGCEGLHHIAYWTDRFEETIAKHDVWQSGAIGSKDNRFAYLSTKSHAGTIVEISEVSGMKGQLFAHIARTCAAWDGSEPVRRL